MVKRNETRGKGVNDVSLSSEELSRREVLSIGEFCQWAGISRASADRCIKDGQLAAAKIRNRTIIRRDDARKFLAGLPLS